MDSTLYNQLYSNSVKKFTAAAKNASVKDYYGNWPVGAKTNRLLLLYVYALQLALTFNLSDEAIFAIVHRVNELKYD